MGFTAGVFTHHNHWIFLQLWTTLDSAVLDVPRFFSNKPYVSFSFGKDISDISDIRHHDAKDLPKSLARLSSPGSQAVSATPEATFLSADSDEPRATPEKVHRRVVNEVPNENANPTIA